MNILFSSPQFPKNENQSTLSQVAHRLTDRGHEVSGVYEAGAASSDAFPTEGFSVPSVKSPWWVRLWYYNHAWRRRISSYLSAHDPDVVVAHQRTHVPTVQAARGHGIPVVAIVEGLGFMRFDPQNHRMNKMPQFAELPLKSKLQYPFVRSLFRQQCRGFTHFAAVVALSGFISDVVQATFGVDTRVIRTMVDINDVRAEEREPECITMMNPRTELKGGDIFLEIAGVMPDTQFVIAGEFASSAQRETAATLNNITYLGWMDDVREVYRRTKVLLVPSLVEEGGPRVIVEAFANGIPVVGTNRGGIPEFIDDAGAIVDEPHSISQWVKEIEAVIDNYDCLSGLANDRARRFGTATTINRYVDLLKAVTK